MGIEIKIQRIIEASDASADRLTARDTWRLLARWRAAFAAEVLERTGSATHLGYEWHAFSYGFSPAHEGSAAVDEARRRSGGSYYVLSAWTGAEFGFRCQGPLPDLGSLRVDTIVASTDMDWTLVFTHEPGIGPYFAAT